MHKSTATNIPFLAYDPTTGEPKTGLDDITASLSKDGNTASTIERTITEIGSGWYSIALTAEDTTASTIVLTFTASDAAFYSVVLELEDYTTSSQLISTRDDIIGTGNQNWMTATQTTLSTSTKESIAKYVLKTSIADVESTAPADSLAGQVLATFHSVVSTDGTWTIKQTNDQDIFATKKVLSSASAHPITGVQNNDD